MGELMKDKASIIFRTKNIITYFFVVMLILSNSIFTYTNSSGLNDLIKFLVIFSAFILLISNVNHNTILLLEKKYIKCFLIYIFYFGIYIILRVPRHELFAFLLRYIVFIPIMILYFIILIKKKDKQNDELELISILKAFSNVVIIIGAISVFLWVFGTQLSIIKPTGEILTSWGGVKPYDGQYSYANSYFNIYFESQLNRVFGVTSFRNSGIFCEAPAYNFFLCLALGIEIFVMQKKSKVKIIIIIITIITTFTNTGYLYLLCIGLIFLIKKSGKYRKYIVGIFTLLFAVAAILLIFRPERSASLQLRVNDYVNGFKGWIKSPILGYGYKCDTYKLFRSGYSNSVTSILLYGGIMLLAVYILPMIKLIQKNLKKNIECLFMILTILYLFILTIVPLTFVMLTILAYGYSLIFIEAKQDTRGKVNTLNKKMSIFVVTHKKFDVLKKNNYYPMMVGSIYRDEIDSYYLRDDVDDNISEKNDSYCELTGLYWIWKNIKVENMGMVHYRRYFVKFNSLNVLCRGKYLVSRKKNAYTVLEDAEIEEILENVDIIVKESPRRMETVWEGFSSVFGDKYCENVRDIVFSKYPEYKDVFEKCMREKTHFNCNMFVGKKVIIDRYCEWLFDILDEVDKKHIKETGDRYHNREIGYIGEMLFKVWIDYNKVNYKIIPAVNIEDESSVMTLKDFFLFSTRWLLKKIKKG